MKLRSLPFRPFRRAAQVGIALLFAVIPFLNRQGMTFLAGNFFYFEAAGAPLADPLSTLQVALGAFSLTPSAGLGAGLVLLLALLMGPVFCAWICPYGLFSELAHGIASACGRGAKKTAADASVPFPSFAPKAFLVCAGLPAVLFFAPVPLLNYLSMPGWYALVMQHIAFYGEILPGALAFISVLLAVESLSGRRLWCLYLCPQSVLISLAAAVLPGRLRVRFNGKSCICRGPENPCRGRCSLGLDPRAVQRKSRLYCVNCGDCIDACREKGGALNFAFGKAERLRSKSS
ncbi:MAG: 4Fe-4S binding protein [Desulfovibrio sp.]|nr:4Fe-4S binding protein [Desulfovibrio sp.]